MENLEIFRKAHKFEGKSRNVEKSLGISRKASEFGKNLKFPDKTRNFMKNFPILRKVSKLKGKSPNSKQNCQFVQKIAKSPTKSTAAKRSRLGKCAVSNKNVNLLAPHRSTTSFKSTTLLLSLAVSKNSKLKYWQPRIQFGRSSCGKNRTRRKLLTYSMLTTNR